jgi:hypothetical protein
MRHGLILVVVLITAFQLTAQTTVKDSWLTSYEQSGFLRTPRYTETIDYCRRLAAGSPWVKYTSFGVSPQGRDLPLVILSKEKAFTPAAAQKSGKAIVLVQSGIHSGEIDGKDASLMLMREIAISKTERHLLDHAILLFVPIFNVDGHERMSPYNRINQNGPEEMGWRVTAQNLNLNRDYMKADAPEMRAMLTLFTKWLPDLYIDCHVTDGIDFQYDVTYAAETGANIDGAVGRWMKEAMLPDVLPRVEATGHKIFYYVFPREDNDLTKGINAEATTPRFSTGYAALQNRPALLIETHMLKPYRTRVSATYELLKAVIDFVNRDAGNLRTAVRTADGTTTAAGNQGGYTLPLRFGIGTGSTMRKFLAVESRLETGEISGDRYPVYSDTPTELMAPIYEQVIVRDSVTVPLAYVIPPEWVSVKEVLRAHAIALECLTAPVTLEVESYKFGNVKFRERPYEGRQGVTFSTETIREVRTYPRGTIVVRTNQRAAKVAIHLLEPRAPDSFVGWGFFNAIFEQKEYAERYVFEKVGKKLLADNPGLKKEFEEKINADTSFARDPSARINWLYQRSPWGDPWLNKYPVGRIIAPVALKTEKL